MILILLQVALILILWVSPGLSADIIPSPPPSIEEKRPADPNKPNTPPSNIDPGIERRPQTVPDPRSAIAPPNVDPKMAIDPETVPPGRDKTKPNIPNEPAKKPSTR